MSPPGSEIEIRIESLSSNGDGVGRHEGRVVFVPLTAPGDRVLARIVRAYPRYARARLLEVLAPGPERVEPPCPVYGRCGGCTWMHLSAEAQRAGYARILQDAFERIGRAGDLPRIDVLPSPARFGYRSRARVAVERGRVGFRARASRNVVDVERCAVLDPETQEELERLRARPPAGPVEVEIRGFGEKVELASGEMRVGPRSFFQPNRRLWEDWQSAVAERCGRGRCLVELYAGAGFYTALLTRRFDRVVAVEKGPAAKDARLNTTAEVIEASAESWAPRYMAGLAPEVVLVNPPRAGCHASVLRAIREAGPRRCVYVSCEPTTLARDAERLAERYRVMEILLIDALPQTHHVEAVCVLGREGSGGSSSDAC